MCQIILFDVDGVLIHGYHAREELRHCWDEHIERDLGIDRDAFKENFIYGSFVEEVLIGQKDLQDALKEFLPTEGYKDDPQTVIDYWLRHDSKINDDLLDVIKELKNHMDVRLYIATNQEDNRARYLMENLGFSRYFDDIFHSGRIGALKPEKA